MKHPARWLVAPPVRRGFCSLLVSDPAKSSGWFGGWEMVFPLRPQHPLSTALAVLLQSRFLMNGARSNSALVARRRVRSHHPSRSFGFLSARLLPHLVRPTSALKKPTFRHGKGALECGSGLCGCPEGLTPLRIPPALSRKVA